MTKLVRGAPPSDLDWVALETPMLRLPGANRAAAVDPTSPEAAKILRRDGRLDSAGGMVFFDRSVALIAGSSPSVRAPWHDYVRPGCGAPGLVAAATGLREKLPAPPDLEDQACRREWCAAVWEQGGPVVYHADVAVRVDGDSGEPSVPLEASAWQRVLDLRQARPRELSNGAGRPVMAHDDVEACRG